MEVTELLRRAHKGDQDALRTVVPIVYEELKRLARSHLRRERAEHSVQTTVLVHEAFIRIARSRLPECEDRSHFFGIAARVMRQVLVDMARERQANKRGAGHEFSLAEIPDFGLPQDSAFLALNDALERLSTESPLKSRLIELRFFCGLTAEEVAETVSLPVHVVRKEMRLARAWLVNALE